jgi:hypothetical protein
MKFENNWQFKTLENLEKKVWPKVDFTSDLVTRTSKLRKVPLNEFSIEDLRIMIGQNFGLPYLIPLAIDRLKENILAEGDLYPGDLLVAVASIESGFWEEHSTYKKEIDTIISDNFSIIADSRLKLGKYFRR